MRRAAQVAIMEAGRWNAVAFWFDAQLGPAACDGSGGGCGAAPEPGPHLLSWGGFTPQQEGAPAPAATSWQHGLQYLDDRAVARVCPPACPANACRSAQLATPS